MTFESEIFDLAEKVKEYKVSDNLATEEATKFAIIMPFVSRVLGYDVFNPKEVIPEFTADVGTRNGEKVDYAIKVDNEIQILIEAKQINTNLSLKHSNQLYRYFTATNTRIGILTNGQIWQFYSDLEKSNIMDEVPFLTIDLASPEQIPVSELKKFSKEAFDLNSVLASAEDLKYLSAFKHIFTKEFEAPSDDFLRFAVKSVYDGKLTAQRLDMIRPLAIKAIKQVIQERVTDLFQNDLKDSQADLDEESFGNTTEKEIETTIDEIKAFYLIRGILHPEVSFERITFKDTKSYFGLQIDGNGRKTWLRLYLDGNKPRVMFVNTWTQITLGSIEELGSHKAALLESFNDIDIGKAFVAEEIESDESLVKNTSIEDFEEQISPQYNDYSPRRILETNYPEI